uniref:Saposin B-type domain-containing protein n=1 Tax=Acrobeloides nanus TaxID=290746 RepID=A0A914CW96_9BILA
MCDDIVQIVEMFANCAEDYIVNQADMWCDQQCGNDAVLASICHDLVDNLYKIFPIPLQISATKVFVGILTDFDKMKNIIFLASLAIFLHVYDFAGIPANVTYPYKQECGLFVIPKINLTEPNPRNPQEKASVWCDLCLEIVNIAQMYAECYEADAQDFQIQWCVDYYKGDKYEAVCRYIVNGFWQSIEKDTESIDPVKVCNAIIKFPDNSTCVEQ